MKVIFESVGISLLLIGFLGFLGFLAVDTWELEQTGRCEQCLILPYFKGELR